MITTVIFDMDGVISDTQKAHSCVEREMLLSHGIDIDAAEISRRFAGVSLREMFPAIFAEHGKEMPDLQAIIEDKWSRITRIAGNDVPEIPGAKDLIGKLRRDGYQLGVASGSRPAFIQLVLAALNLTDTFHAVTSSYEVERGKPDPAVFLLAAQRLGAKPEECVVIEDAISGMTAAKSAGMKCIGLVASRHDAYPADMLVERLDELSVELLRRF